LIQLSLSLFALWFLISNELDDPPMWLGSVAQKLSYSPTFGRGKGARGFKRSKRRKFRPGDVWGAIRDSFDNQRLESLIHMKVDEFELLLKELTRARIHSKLKDLAVKLTFGNKILLVFVWIVQYPSYAILSNLFGVSIAVVSQLISHTLAPLVGYFSKWIPNSVDETFTSHLSPHILAVIDGTVHKIRRPSLDQYKTWNDHYQFHAVQTLFLVSFSGEILACSTNINGFVHDANSSSHNYHFRRVLNGKLALGDPGFQGVDYVVAGLKSNQVKTQAHFEFDRITRSEQVVVEHVNNFVKKQRTLSKGVQFIHCRSHLVACVFIVAGWYNFMFNNFNKYQ